MPNYLGVFGHRNQTIVAAATLCAIPAFTGRVTDLFVSGGALLGLLIHPDWDLNPNAMGLIGKIGFVDEYAALVPHRAFLSHTPVVGTLIRVVLTFTIPLLLVWGICHWFPPWGIILRVFAGLCMADTLHCVADKLQTWAKHKTRHFGRRKRRRKV